MFDLLSGLFGLGLYIADISSDIGVFLLFMETENPVWAAWTLTFIVLPNIVTAVMSLNFSAKDGYACTCKFCTKIAFDIMLIGPIITSLLAARNGLQSIVYGYKGLYDKQEKHISAWADQIVNYSMLAFVESFLESAPQLMLQLNVLLSVSSHYMTLEKVTTRLFISVVLSFGSLAWAVVTCEKAQR